MHTQINLSNGYNLEGSIPLLFNEMYETFPNIFWIGEKKYQDVVSLIEQNRIEYSIEELNSTKVYTHDKTDNMCEMTRISILYKLKNSILLYFSKEYKTDNVDITVYFINKGEPTDLIEKLKNLPKFSDKETSKIYTLISENGRLSTTYSTLDPINLDIAENYNDDFVEIDKLIKDGLSTTKKGIVMLHGNPGTGKTYYLRYLIHHLNKRVLYVPASIASEISSPHFIPLLLENRNSILIIEDAENIIRTRKSGGNAAVSNLLNLADGLLSDVLSTQIICSFNCDINDIDEALLRKGRIIARYEFNQLKVEKAQKLSNKLGFQTIINKPMNLTEIYNQGDSDFKSERAKIGF